MSIYDQRTRAGNPRNPAKALYSYWYSILRDFWTVDSNGRPRGVLQFGHDRGYGIGPVDPNYLSGDVSEIGTNEWPHLAFGGAWRTWASVNNDFIVTRNGEFRMTHFHGHESRNRVARNTFLDWLEHASRYQWFVNPKEPVDKWSAAVLRNWRNPVYYLEERLLVSGYGAAPAWFKLVHDTGFVGNWRIAYSRPAVVSKNYNWYRQSPTAEAIEAYDALRTRRYHRLRETELLSSGELQRRGRRTISTREIEERREEQAIALAALLDVKMPARTVPLKRTSEEEVTHGNDMGAHDPDGAQAVAPGQR